MHFFTQDYFSRPWKESYFYMPLSECDISSRDFSVSRIFSFFWEYRYRSPKFWSKKKSQYQFREKVSASVSKILISKKSLNQPRESWSRKKSQYRSQKFCGHYFCQHESSLDKSASPHSRCHKQHGLGFCHSYPLCQDYKSKESGHTTKILSSTCFTWHPQTKATQEISCEIFATVIFKHSAVKMFSYNMSKHSAPGENYQYQMSPIILQHSSVQKWLLIWTILTIDTIPESK